MERVRNYLRENMETLTNYVNAAFRDSDFLRTLQDAIARNSPNNTVPPWFNDLLREGGLRVTNGKSIGSIVEKVVAAVIEVYLVPNIDGIEPFRVMLNPASGVDLPQIELGIKSPSENWDTSEPFFSPFERLTGNVHDCIVFLTNFQQVKDSLPYTLAMIDNMYLDGSELSDHVLTGHARRAREIIGVEDERYIEFCRFLCLMNKNRSEDQSVLNQFLQYFDAIEAGYRNIISLESCELLLTNWMNQFAGVFQQLTPTELERQRLESGPLTGHIGISFALQWRYNFRTTFN